MWISFVPLLSQAQQRPTVPERHRPRIGLALSGGGARGAAHIGVLKVLEELRVPVHCVAGTSMGAVVGGAYAAGNTAKEMQRLIRETDWSEVFTDRPPRGELSARRKADDYKGLFAPEFGLRDREILLPRGVVAGVSIENFLRHLAAPAAGIDDFDRLPIPYRAVAADIESGQEVVLGSGSLRQAMRASMAIPGAVSPVEIDGRLLVDGGIANNLPIDLVRSTCADVVIAVNISTPPMKREEITSALSVVGQLVNLLGKEKVDRQLAQLGAGDVLVKPELGDITAASFERQLEAIAIGERAARAVAGALGRYSLPASEYAALRAAQVAHPEPLGKVDEIQFEGIERSNPEVLYGLIQSRPGEALDETQLASDLRRIYGRGDFEAVDYRIDQQPGRRTLVIPVREKSIGPTYLRFGLGLASDLHDGASYNALISYRRTWMNRAGGEWLAEAQIGRDNFLFTEFYQPLERPGRYFIAPYTKIGQSIFGAFEGDHRVAEYRVRDARVGLDLGLVLGTWGELRAGPLLRQVDAKVSTGSTILPRIDARVQGFSVQLFGDRQDTAWIPRTGHRTAASLFVGTEMDGSQHSYRRFEGLWTGAYSLQQHTLAATLSAGGAAGGRLPIYEGFTLGGPLRLSGYRIGQFFGERFAFASLRYYNRLVQLPTLLASGVYIGGSAEAGRVDRLYASSGSTGTLWSASVYAAAETFLGPVYLGLGTGGRDHFSLYFLLGRP
ncbi:patatin-like phospholipase family protein [Aquabacterium sp. A7-Y]|uniref:patatin-like phospholipase family protein n=1 Tax=Aquabacterium sp. A7-Y TaxID=1349605 RepID=UPI00223DA640|nr:patatin-like phospholipase family protein [Aquabacterium sp. A7-Y]MCW7540392.1 patatin-like phospholipase family protein [Aquabacterium sp. A7-Y]